MNTNEYIESVHRGMCDNGGCGGPVAFAFILLLFLLASCKQIEYIPVIEHRTDTTYINRVQKDSVWLHDSVFVSVKGDSTLIEKWHTKYVTKEVHDTLYRAKADSIPVPYEVTKEVPAELSWWQELRLWLGNISLIGILVLLGYGGWKLYNVAKFF